jgi:hypothetical protein
MIVRGACCTEYDYVLQYFRKYYIRTKMMYARHQYSSNSCGRPTVGRGKLSLRSACVTRGGTNETHACTLLRITNSPPRYLSEFLFGGRVAGRVIYYLFEILHFSCYVLGMGEFAAGRVMSYILSFGNLNYRASWWASYLIYFRILGASSGSGEFVMHSRVHALGWRTKFSMAVAGVPSYVVYTSTGLYINSCTLFRFRPKNN